MSDKEEQVYALLDESGDLACESEKLPFFALRSVAKERADELDLKMVKVKITWTVIKRKTKTYVSK